LSEQRELSDVAWRRLQALVPDGHPNQDVWVMPRAGTGSGVPAQAATAFGGANYEAPFAGIARREAE